MIHQPKDGYRFTIDPLILCSRVSPRSCAHILDVGCGCGIMPLLLGFRYPQTCITGVDIQKALTDIAVKNVTANQMQRRIRIRILNQDINGVTLQDIGRPADIIICNPPYKKRGTGRMNPLREKAIARHEILVTIDQIFASAAALLAPNGRIYLIFPADRMSDLTSAAASSGFFFESICPVHQSKNTPPFRVVVSATKNQAYYPKPLTPLILYRKDNRPTKAHQTLFNP